MLAVPVACCSLAPLAKNNWLFVFFQGPPFEQLEQTCPQTLSGFYPKLGHQTKYFFACPKPLKSMTTLKPQVPSSRPQVLRGVPGSLSTLKGGPTILKPSLGAEGKPPICFAHCPHEFFGLQIQAALTSTHHMRLPERCTQPHSAPPTGAIRAWNALVSASWKPKGGYGKGGLPLIKPLIRPY